MTRQSFLKQIGPGIITGASDNDPSAITAYSTAGAAFGFAFLWLPLAIFPVLIVFIYLFSFIAHETGSGFSDNIRKHYNPFAAWALSLSLGAANTFQIGANLGGITSILEHLTGISYFFWIVIISAVITFVLIRYKYDRIKSIFKWFTLLLFAYIISGILSEPDWAQVIPATFSVNFDWSITFFSAFLGILGSALSPYLFFWQSNLVVEEKNNDTDGEKKEFVFSDILLGMFFAVVIIYFIILTAGNTLNKEGITELKSIEDMAKVLKPAAGKYAYAIFSIGFIGSAMFCIPALAVSAAYAVAETKKWRNASLEKDASEAPKFYSVIIAAIIIGIALNLLGINPVDMLFISAVINGIITLPVLFFVNHLSSRRLKIKKPAFTFMLWLSRLFILLIIVVLALFAWQLIKKI